MASNAQQLSKVAQANFDELVRKGYTISSNPLQHQAADLNCMSAALICILSQMEEIARVLREIGLRSHCSGCDR